MWINGWSLDFLETEIDGKHIEVIRIHKALLIPVSYEKIEYIRSGSYTKKLNEYPELTAQLWDKLRNSRFEDVIPLKDLRYADILRVIDSGAYFSMLKIPYPTDENEVMHYLIEDGVAVKLDNGLYGITNLGAILFAKDLNFFPRLGRKAMRVVLYQGKNRLFIQKEETFNSGYAVCFEEIVRFVNALLPSSEDTTSVALITKSKYPLPSVREAIANSLIHQDLYINPHHLQFLVLLLRMQMMYVFFLRYQKARF